MEKTDLYYKKYLQDELARRCEKNSGYSLRAFAKACDLAPGALSQILSGKRVPSYKMAQKLLQRLNLSPQQQNLFLSSLSKKQNGRNLKRISPVFKYMTETSQPVEINLDVFRVISDWYHYAILMLTFVQGFKSNIKWIASQLEITELEAKLAVERLLSVGLLKEEKGKWMATKNHITTTDKHTTNSALKKHTKQSLEKAIYSLENDPIEMRSHTYMTMAIDPTKIPQAKILIDDFTNKMSAFLEKDKKTQVFEFGIYLYPLQKTNS